MIGTNHTGFVSSARMRIANSPAYSPSPERQLVTGGPAIVGLAHAAEPLSADDLFVALPRVIDL